MNDGIPLREYLDRPGWTQMKLAHELGVVQTAISYVLRHDKEIYVFETPDGLVAKEVCPFPRRDRKV